MPDTTAINIGSRREPFIDRLLIDRLEGVDHRLHHPVQADKAIAFDAPWEGLFSGCITVLHDGERYRMYYRGMPGLGSGDNEPSSCCVAFSDDAIHWERPELGLFDYPDHPVNNIVELNDDKRHCHNFCPFIDTHPDVPDSERFKAIGGLSKRGIFAFTSPDGLRWRVQGDGPILTTQKFAFDSQNVAFWSEHEGCYVAYFRTWHPVGFETEHKFGVRWVSRATSPDFVNWSAHEEMTQDDGVPWEEIYTQQTSPYFGAPHIYVALAARFWPGRKVVTDEQAKELGVHPDYCSDISDAVLMTSRGGAAYDRTFLESFVRPGPGLRNWISRTNYPGLGILPTGDGEMSMWIHQNYASPQRCARRLVLREDGFASLHAGYTPGEMITHLLTFTGGTLKLNMATSAAGSVRVELLQADGRPIPGRSLDDADELIGDEINRTVTWAGGSDVSAAAGQPVRLRLAIKDADVFALQFGT